MALNDAFSDRVISIPEAATLAGISPDTLRRCHKREELKLIKLSPRRVGVRLSELQRFINDRAA
jgi:predicted DNA-binding transcriptional regulator AlpA